MTLSKTRVSFDGRDAATIELPIGDQMLRFGVLIGESLRSPRHCHFTRYKYAPESKFCELGVHNRTFVAGKADSQTDALVD